METRGQIGWYRLYDQGKFGVQVMHYKLDGTPGQCCTVDRADLPKTVKALEEDYVSGGVGYGFWRRHEQPFAWERSRLQGAA